MPNISLLTPFLQVSVLAKIATLTLLFLYIGFAFIIFNQIRTMGKIVHTSSTNIMLTASLAQILIALSLFFVALAIL